MSFLLSGAGGDSDGALPDGAWKLYRDYLKRERERFPPSAFGLATADWYYDVSDPRCPHDARLEECVVSELASGGRGSPPAVQIRLRLRGAYDDGHIELRYPRVFRYELGMDNGRRGHQDWRHDEFRLGADGRLVHEIEWWGVEETARWVIEASDVEYRWIPLGVAPPPSGDSSAADSAARPPE